MSGRGCQRGQQRFGWAEDELLPLPEDLQHRSPGVSSAHALEVRQRDSSRPYGVVDDLRRHDPVQPQAPELGTGEATSGSEGCDLVPVDPPVDPGALARQDPPLAEVDDVLA